MEPVYIQTKTNTNQKNVQKQFEYIEKKFGRTNLLVRRKSKKPYNRYDI